MTTVTFHTEGSRITGFEARGHSGYAAAGAESTCQALLTGMMVYLTSLHEEYPDFIEVLEA